MAIPLLLLVLLATFAMGLALPGDPVEMMLGKYSTPEQERELRADLGLDQSVPAQFATYVGNVAQADLGRSYTSKAPVTRELSSRIPATAELAMAAMILATIFGVSLGVLTALKPRSWWDMLGLTGALAGVSIPIFWLGLLVIRAVRTGGWLSEILPGFDGMPVGGRYSSEWAMLPTAVQENAAATGFYLWDTLLVFREPGAFLDVLAHLTIPAFVLATVPAAMIARITRASVGEAMLQDYIRTAKAKGLTTRVIITRHALRNAAIPIVTTVGTQLGYLLGGAVLTETIFGWPGIGTYVVVAIENRDWPQLQGAVLFVAVVFIAINLLVDLSYGLLDPRVRVSGKRGVA